MRKEWFETSPKISAIYMRHRAIISRDIDCVQMEYCLFPEINRCFSVAEKCKDMFMLIQKPHNHKGYGAVISCNSYSLINIVAIGHDTGDAKAGINLYHKRIKRGLTFNN